MCISFRLVDHLSHILRFSSLVILESYGFAIGANIAAPGFTAMCHRQELYSKRKISQILQ